MASANANFEIQIMKGGRWIAECVRDSEDDARTVATKLLANKTCEGARIIRNWMRGDGKMVEAEVFCQTREVRDDAPVRIVPVEDVPPRCEQPEQYYGLSSRMVMNRIFRQYLEKAFLTPTELIHNYKELSRIQDKDTLVPSAVDRVAALQTRDGDLDARARREEIFKSIDQMAVRARRAEALKLPKLNGSVSALCKNVERFAEKDCDAEYLSLVVLSQELVPLRNFLAKLDRLCTLAAEEADPASIRLLDGMIADVLGANIVQEILGWQPGLGHAICAMLDLAEGNLQAEGSEAAAALDVLNKLFADGKLPASRECLIDRALRQLRSPNPLYRNDPTKENETFRMVIRRVLTPTGLMRGPETAEALTTRQTRMVEEGGAPGRKAAMANTLRAMPDRAFGVMYLADLANSSYAQEHLVDIAQLMDSTSAVRRLGDLCENGLPPKERMLRATAAFNKVAETPLPKPVQAKICTNIDNALERYIIEEQVIEKLDHQDSLLRDRATRLVQFCGAKVLPEGKALTRARTRVLELLRQPSFDQHFIEGVTDPAIAGEMLRNFHQMLVRAGFGG